MMPNHGCNLQGLPLAKNGLDHNLVEQQEHVVEAHLRYLKRL
jgi:hypothetical protein